MLPGPNDQPGRYAPRPELPEPHPEISDTGSHVPDQSRTSRNRAGEMIEDTRDWPGLILMFLGLVAVGLTLTAAGYGFAGWAVVGSIVAVLCLVIGAVLIALEHRRVSAHARHLNDPHGH